MTLVGALAVAILAVDPASAEDYSGGCHKVGKHCGSDAECCEGLICADGLRCGSGCRIDGTLYAAGAANPQNPCLVCRPDASTQGWSPAPDGTSCDDGQVCTTQDACRGGNVRGGARPPMR